MQWDAFNQLNAQEAGEGEFWARDQSGLYIKAVFHKNLLTEKGQRGYELEGSLLIGNVNTFSETADS